MWTLLRSLGWTALAAVVLGLASSSATAAPPHLRPKGPTFIPTRPNTNPFFVTPNSILQQQQYRNQALALATASAYGGIPPYLMGYNPYLSPLNYGLASPYGLMNPYLMQYNALYNPYAGIYSVNPFNPYALYGLNYLFQ